MPAYLDPTGLKGESLDFLKPIQASVGPVAGQSRANTLADYDSAPRDVLDPASASSLLSDAIHGAARAGSFDPTTLLGHVPKVLSRRTVR